MAAAGTSMVVINIVSNYRNTQVLVKKKFYIKTTLKQSYIIIVSTLTHTHARTHSRANRLNTYISNTCIVWNSGRNS